MNLKSLAVVSLLLAVLFAGLAIGYCGECLPSLSHTSGNTLQHPPWSSSASQVPTPTPMPLPTPTATPTLILALASSPIPPTPATKTYQVKAGDTLWELADRFYCAGWQWRRIAQANGIHNPRRLQIGTILVIP